MMLGGMATTKAASKRQAAGKVAAGRKRSKLTLAREEAARLAGRTLLLGTCEALKWNLTRVAETLDMATPSDVIRSLKELAPEEYEAAQKRGDVATRRDS
jgi:hypothetical protein